MLRFTFAPRQNPLSAMLHYMIQECGQNLKI